MILFDILSSNAGLQDIVEEIIIREGIYMIFTFLYEFLLFRYLDTATILKISQVCRCWRDLVRTCFVWKKLARRSGIILVKICPDTPTSCSCQTQVRKQLRWRRNFRNGKYRKLFVPFLKRRNYNEEIERFTSCLDFDSRRLIFGSNDGSLMSYRGCSL